MTQQQIERIRNPQFPVSRRGYDQREVDNFMLALAEWLENGGLEEAGSYAVTRRLERAGETTARVLATAQTEADQIVKDAEAEARRTIGDAQEAARTKLEQTRTLARDIVEEAERKRAEIKDTISQLSNIQRRVVEEIGRLREVNQFACVGSIQRKPIALDLEGAEGIAKLPLGNVCEFRNLCGDDCAGRRWPCNKSKPRRRKARSQTGCVAILQKHSTQTRALIPSDLGR